MTYHVLSDVVAATESATPDQDVDAGKLIIMYDGEKYKIVRGVTSLVATSDVSRVFKKIKHVEGADMIVSDIRKIFEDEYVGKVTNSYEMCIRDRVFFDRQDPDVFLHHSTFLDNRFIDEAFHRRMLRRRSIDPDGYRVYG